jgi:hypothetical protein
MLIQLNSAHRLERLGQSREMLFNKSSWLSYAVRYVAALWWLALWLLLVGEVYSFDTCIRILSFSTIMVQILLSGAIHRARARGLKRIKAAVRQASDAVKRERDSKDTINEKQARGLFSVIVVSTMLTIQTVSMFGLLLYVVVSPVNFDDGESLLDILILFLVICDGFAGNAMWYLIQLGKVRESERKNKTMMKSMTTSLAPHIQTCQSVVPSSYSRY